MVTSCLADIFVMVSSFATFLIIGKKATRLYLMFGVPITACMSLSQTVGQASVMCSVSSQIHVFVSLHNYYTFSLYTVGTISTRYMHT